MSRFVQHFLIKFTCSPALFCSSDQRFFSALPSRCVSVGINYLFHMLFNLIDMLIIVCRANREAKYEEDQNNENQLSKQIFREIKNPSQLNYKSRFFV